MHPFTRLTPEGLPRARCSLSAGVTAFSSADRVLPAGHITVDRQTVDKCRGGRRVGSGSLL